jgi:hypothetical protein
MKVTQILRLFCIALEIENEYHFVIECNKLISSRSKLYSKVTEIVPNFLVMSDSDKFKYIFSSYDYDIMNKFFIDMKSNKGLSSATIQSTDIHKT